MNTTENTKVITALTLGIVLSMSAVAAVVAVVAPHQAVQAAPDEEQRAEIGAQLNEVANQQGDKVEVDEEGFPVEGDNHFDNYARMQEHKNAVIDGSQYDSNNNDDDKDNGRDND